MQQETEKIHVIHTYVKTWVENDTNSEGLWLKRIVCVLLIFLTQKVVDDKGAKAKKGGAKGKKDDGPAQNGDTKTNEVCGGNTGSGGRRGESKFTFSWKNARNNDFYSFILSICVQTFVNTHI